MYLCALIIVVMIVISGCLLNDMQPYIMIDLKKFTCFI